MIQFFVKRPATTIVFVLFFVVLGLVSYFNLATELTPKVDFPIVTVTVKYPGATPLEVETQVVKRIEDAVAELSDIKKIMSRSYESLGYIFIEFNLGVDANIKAMETKDKIEPILNDLPDKAEKPLVEKFDLLATPIVELVLSSDKHNATELYEFADKKLKNKISNVSGVASVDLYGGKKRQINVKIDPELAKLYYVSINDVVKRISNRNLNLPGGVIDKSDESISVRFVGEFASVDEIANMEILTREGTKIKLKEMATVEDSFKKIETAARFNGQETVGMSVKKVSDGNSVKIGKGLLERLPALQSALPEGMTLKVASDTTEYIIRETVDTIKNIAIGILLTVLVLYLFTGRLGVTFIASIIIPSSIISAVFLVDKSGFTVNMMTLLAIATALGTLVANAIVVIESILSQLDKGKDRVTAAIDGTKDVAVAVFAASGTNLVVFLPIAFMGGIVGQFLKQFGLTVAYATIFSILASFTLTPMLCSIMLKDKASIENAAKSKKKRFNPFIWLADKTMNFIINEYRHVFNIILRFPKSTILFSFLCLAGSLWLVKYIGNEFMPNEDQDRIQILIVMPQGSTIEKTLRVSKQIETYVAGIPEVKSYLTSAGDNGVENAKVTVNLYPLAQRKRNDLAIINELIPKLAKIPDAEINMMRGDGMGGNDGDITINVYGVDYEKMIDYSKKMVDIMGKTGYFRSITSSYKVPKDELKFMPNEEKMVVAGISYPEVASAIRSSLYGDDTNVYKEAGEEYDINVEMSSAYKDQFSDIAQINVITASGMVNVTSLGEVKREQSIPTIYRRDKERVIQIDGFLSKSSAGIVNAELEKDFKKMGFEQGYGYRQVGNAEYQEESNREISKAFILASILTYMLLVALMNSFVHPFTISTSIITAFSGVFAMLFFTESSINIASMLGMVMLVGVVVNNAILVLDHTMAKMKEGLGIVEALWAGIEGKFRAVLMSSIAIIFGTMPQMWSNDVAKSSMGAVVTGGIFASIVWTYILIPVVFVYLEKMVRFFNRRKSSNA